MLKRTVSLMLACILAIASFTLSASANTAVKETIIKLSDSGVTVDGITASSDYSTAVYTGAQIVYYEAGRGSSYGEGTAADAHSAEEAATHTVVTITQPGVYRVSGKLSAGQLAIDLGEDAVTDPTAVVTLILDGVDITNTVAPGVIFYNVYEPYSASQDTKGIVDLSNAGAQVIIADGSVNTIDGSYVARIYKEGTTKKLHKYDGAFYSKMSMNVSGGALGTGELYINGANEGLNSELHLSINGGNIYIEAQDDGINTNEDGISVTTINGGYLHVNAGLGAEGDGIDSNGYLTINGGKVVTMSNPRTPDGGIDADKDITINGGTVIALGTRNDATSTNSDQPYMELSFATTQAAGSTIILTDAAGNELLSHKAEKAFQSVTFSAPTLRLQSEYRLYVDGKLQQYTGNSSGRMGGGFGGSRPGVGGQWGQPGASTGTGAAGSTSFVISDTIHSFSGITEAAEGSGKTRVTFSVNNGEGVKSVATGQQVLLEQIVASANVPDSDIQLTVTDIPSEDFAETYLLSELKGDFTKLLPTEDGQYRLTVAVVSTNSTFTGASQWQFTIGILPFTDIQENDPAYAAIKNLYNRGIMLGTSATTFSPNESVTRAIAITTLGRLLEVEQLESTTFNDVVSNSWYSGYVGWAANNGLVLGDGKGNFMPNHALTGSQLKLVFSRYVELNELNIDIDKLLPNAGNEQVTRAQLATILNELL